MAHRVTTLGLTDLSHWNLHSHHPGADRLTTLGLTESPPWDSQTHYPGPHTVTNLGLTESPIWAYYTLTELPSDSLSVRIVWEEGGQGVTWWITPLPITLMHCMPLRLASLPSHNTSIERYSFWGDLKLFYVKYFLSLIPTWSIIVLMSVFPCLHGVYIYSQDHKLLLCQLIHRPKLQLYPLKVVLNTSAARVSEQARHKNETLTFGYYYTLN